MNLSLFLLSLSTPVAPVGLQPPLPWKLPLLSFFNWATELCDVKIWVVWKSIHRYLPASSVLGWQLYPLLPCKATFLISVLFIRGNEGSMKCAFTPSVQGLFFLSPPSLTPSVSLSSPDADICEFCSHLAMQKLWISHLKNTLSWRDP